MRKRNAVPQLNRTASHRRAMMRNMATSLFQHERIVTTRAKAKALRVYSEKLITRARKTVNGDQSPHAILHQKREIMKDIKDRDIVKKLVEELGPRYANRNGGYTRIIHQPERQSDSSQMSIIELVDRVEKVRKVYDKKKAARTDDSGSKKSRASATKSGEGAGDARGGDKREGKWYDRFRRKKKADPGE